MFYAVAFDISMNAVKLLDQDILTPTTPPHATLTHPGPLSFYTDIYYDVHIFISLVFFTYITMPVLATSRHAY